MRVALNDQDDRAGLRVYVQFNKYTHTHFPPWEDQREGHRMTRMTRPDCAVMCNLINTHTHTHTHTHTGLRGYVQFNKYTHTHTHTLGRINASGIE